MDETTQLNKQVDDLQRRVRFLTIGFVAVVSILALLFIFVIMRVPDTVRANRVEAEIVVADSITVRSSQTSTDSIVMGAGKSGAHIFLNDSEGKNRMRLNKNGLYIADTSGKHTINLGLSPGPGDLHAPFMVFRDRAGKERISFDLHAEGDEPNIRLTGADAEQFSEISADGVMLYNSDGCIKIRNPLNSVPYLEVRGLGDNGSRQSKRISPSTRLLSPPDDDAR